MSLLALCHRRSILLKIAAATDKAALSWRTAQIDVSLFKAQIVIQQPGFVLITNDSLEDPTLFTAIRATSPQSYIVVCLTRGIVMDKRIWTVLDNLEFDVLCTLDELADCLLTLKAGHFYQSSLLETHSGFQPKEPLPGWHELTPAERRVLKLATDEKTAPQIATTLFISEKTVNNHKAKISQKLGISGGPGSLTRFVLTHREQLLALLD